MKKIMLILVTRIFLVGVFSLFLAGCTLTIPAKVYNIDTGDTFVVSFKYDGSGYGQIEGTMDTGVHCSGEYLTQRGGQSGTSVSAAQGWGSIYGWGASGFASTGSNAVSSYSSQPNTQIGSAILSCEDKNVLQCEYVVNRDNHGTGFCKDNKNHRYKFTH